MRRVNEKKAVILSLLFLVCFTSCESFLWDKEYPLEIVNHATYPIGYYLACGDSQTSAYPDTTLPITNRFDGNIINPGTRQTVLMVSNSWDKFFEQCLPNDTFSVFIFNADTLNTYTWDEIRSGYKVEKRYDLSLDDLERINKVITFP